MFPGTLVLYYFQSYLSGTSPTASQRYFFPQGKNESLVFIFKGNIISTDMNESAKTIPSSNPCIVAECSEITKLQ